MEPVKKKFKAWDICHPHNFNSDFRPDIGIFLKYTYKILLLIHKLQFSEKYFKKTKKELEANKL